LHGFAADGFVLEGSRDVFVAGAVAAHYAVKGPLSVHLRLRYARNENTLSRSLASGLDVLAGVSAAAQLGRVTVGGTAALDVPTGYDRFVPESLGALAAASASACVAGPLSAHGAVSFHLNNRSALSRHVASDLAAFALDAEQYHRLGFRVGVSAAFRRAEPFVAWQLDVPVGSRSSAAQLPQRLTLGARTPLPSGFSVDASVDLGLSAWPVVGVAPTPPWSATLALAWSML
jgi:hypothetical protein